ncbi:unnamed protein product [Adineta ricciae]|uniref:Uncharacterized protein n=1 Tax=Adineta ricciae TaxID=249248 RepID=A0A814NAZ7_ADIRI|nr:unnamed protein product [Adineta ricciae]CAF1646890.1 unnamed protein product [Adineta ricciae]
MSADALNATCEKFFQIWAHKAANISNDLIEYTIRRMQSDRLRFLFQTRNELTQREASSPICQVSVHTEDELRRIKEHIRRFCLTTRNAYRHLRSDSRIYPKMCIELDQGIIIKICRFIFKTKVLVQILSKDKDSNADENEQSKGEQIKSFEYNDPYRNITKAFIILQSNFEILFGDILEKDYFQNAKTAVRSLPVILDTSKTIRLIFCALYKLTEPERQAEAEARRQHRLSHCRHDKSKKLNKIPINNNELDQRLKTINDMLIKQRSEATNDSTITPSKATLKLRPAKSHLNTPKTINSKTSQKRSSSSTPMRTKTNLSKKSSIKMKSPNSNSKSQQRSPNKNANASKTPSTTENDNNNQTQPFRHTKFGWTTWLHNTTLNLSTTSLLNRINKPELPKPVLTTWASLDRKSKS